MKNEPIRDEFIEKRKARQRKAKKKRLIITTITLSVVAVITLVILCLTVFFPISKITASGSEIYTSEEIIENSGIKKGDNLFTFGRKNATNSLKEKLPFIETVDYEIDFPNGIKIKVTDAEPYYCIEKNGDFYNVSKNGWVLEKVSEKQADVFEIKMLNFDCSVGKQIVFKDEKSLEILENVIDLLEENNLKIDYVDVTNTVTINAGVDGRFDVEFGTQNDIESKIKQLKIMVQELNNGEKGLIRLYMWNQQKPDGTFVENYTK